MFHLILPWVPEEQECLEEYRNDEKDTYLKL